MSRDYAQLPPENQKDAKQDTVVTWTRQLLQSEGIRMHASLIETLLYDGETSTPESLDIYNTVNSFARTLQFVVFNMAPGVSERGAHLLHTMLCKGSPIYDGLAHGEYQRSTIHVPSGDLTPERIAERSDDVQGLAGAIIHRINDAATHDLDDASALREFTLVHNALVRVRPYACANTPMRLVLPNLPELAHGRAPIIVEDIQEYRRLCHAIRAGQYAPESPDSLWRESQERSPQFREMYEFLGDSRALSERIVAGHSPARDESRMVDAASQGL